MWPEDVVKIVVNPINIVEGTVGGCGGGGSRLFETILYWNIKRLINIYSG